ncbi:MAG: adenylate/guanylate cyclase domain-containing protein [Actinomycetota bacterium]
MGTSASQGQPDGAEPRWTFVFTDIVDSTAMWSGNADVMAEQLEVHDRILNRAVAEAGGTVFATMGDGLAAAFDDPDAAVTAMVAAQAALINNPWPEDNTIRVRMGAHAGPAHHRNDDYFGPTVNLAARVMSAGHGGQIVITETLAELLTGAALGDTELRVEPLGAHRLKGVVGQTGLAMVRGPAQPAAFPPLRVLDPARFTIPIPSTSIIGRTEELADVLESVRSRRCTTIWATGGAGKTRLAIEVAVRAGDVFPAGVHVIELADLDAEQDIAEDLATRVAELVLGTEATAGPNEHLQRLGTELTEPVLIVVDNAEHVIDECAKAVESLLRASADLTFLVTSREPLRIDGEHAYPLDPLSFTGGDGDGVGTSAAARLFIERATAAAPTAEIDAAVVDEIVERLDGLPLAVELAAAHIGTLGTAQLLNHLDRVLAQAPTRRGGRSRHRTVEAAIDWSVARCSDEDRLLLARLAVFPGSFDLDAINAVCTDDRLDDFLVLGTLGALVERSLVSSFDGPGGRRYRLLRLIRAYADGLSSGIEDLADRHTTYYLDLARTQVEELHRDGSAGLGAAIGEDHDNFAAILERGVTEEEHRRNARRLCVRLQNYWEDTGRLRLGADWMARLGEPHDIGERSWAAVVLVGATYDAMCGLTPLDRQPVDAIRSLADMPMPGVHAMQLPLAFIDLSQGRIDESIERFDKAAAGFDDDPRNGWQALMTAGALCDYNRDPALAAEFYERAAAIDRSALAGWADSYGRIFTVGSELAERGPSSDAATVAELLVALDRLLATGLDTRITIAGHGAMWALEQAGRFDLVAERLPTIMTNPRRTGYLWFTLALADLAASIAVRNGAIDLGLQLEGAVDARLAAAAYGFPVSFGDRRRADARVAVDPERAEACRADGRDLTIAAIDELAARAVATRTA